MKYDGFYVGKTFRVMGNLMFLKTFQQQLRAGGVARFMKNTKTQKSAQKQQELITFGTNPFNREHLFFDQKMQILKFTHFC